MKLISQNGPLFKVYLFRQIVGGVTKNLDVNRKRFDNSSWQFYEMNKHVLLISLLYIQPCVIRKKTECF